jgi:hypothetical protein
VEGKGDDGVESLWRLSSALWRPSQLLSAFLFFPPACSWNGEIGRGARLFGSPGQLSPWWLAEKCKAGLLGVGVSCGQRSPDPVK